MMRELFYEVGCFNDALRDAEDYEFAVRAHKKNIPLYFRNSAFAWHDGISNTLNYIKRQREYTAAHDMLRKIHTDWISEKFIDKKYEPKGIKALIFKLFCHIHWIKAIDKNRLKWLPYKLRYRLYDIIITANGVFYPSLVSLQTAT